MSNNVVSVGSKDGVTITTDKVAISSCQEVSTTAHEVSIGVYIAIAVSVVCISVTAVEGVPVACSKIAI